MSQLLQQDRYIIREKFWKFFGNKLWLRDEQGNLHGFCKQKAFKLKEDIRLYADESMADELLKISARSIIDVWGGYDITDSRSGESLGSARRKALKSILRDNWTLFDPAGNEIGSLVEDSAGMALVRRFIPLGALVPQKFHIDVAGASQPVTLRQKFNPFIRRLVVDIPPGHPLDRRFIAVIALLIATIEGRQG